MNIIYVKKEFLYLIGKHTLIDTNLAVFFSSSKYSLVYINDEEGHLCGFIDHRLYKNIQVYNRIIYQPFTEILVEGQYLTNMVDKIFENNPNLDAIPVVDEKRNLVGAYIKTVSDELGANERVINTIALSILPAFVEELISYLSQIDISKLYIIASDEDYNELESLLMSVIDIKRYNNEYISSEHCIVIDMLYSKSYRKTLSLSIQVDIITLELLLSYVLLPIAIDYVNKKGGKLLFVEGPLKERIVASKHKWPQLYRNLTLPEAVNDKTLLRLFCNEDPNIINWANDTTEGILAGDEVCTNGIHLLMSENLNIDIREENKRCVYLFGPCFTYGACVPNEYRLSSILQHLYPDWRIINNGVKNGRSILNDILYILNTPIKEEDILIDINVFSSKIKTLICNYEPIYDFNDYLNKNINERCQFLDNTFHANAEVTNIAASYLSTLIPDINCFNGFACQNYLQETNKISKINTPNILGKSLMNSYIEYLNLHKRNVADSQVVGSVILTANPITKGHEHLIRIARSRCDLLYVFIVEEDSFEFSTSERNDLVRSVVSDNNIVILSTGKVMTAKYTFPDYYNKSHTKEDIHINQMSDLHFYLFGSVVAPILGITKRFVGEEVSGSITDYYNKKLQSILPSYKIDVEIIPRYCEKSGSIISASKVREMISKQDFSSLSQSLSPWVLQYIEKTRKEVLIRDGRWSATFKRGIRLIKRYKYFVRDAAEREAHASNAARYKGILTPKHLNTKIDNGQVLNVYEYIDMQPIDIASIYDNARIWEQIKCLINDLSKVNWRCDDNYWISNLIPEFKNALSYLDINNKYIDFLESLEPKVFIHGDFTFDNIALIKDDVIIYDFQHGCLGPIGWDKSYIASTMLYSKCKFELSNKELLMAETIAAIRFGRAIRKNIDINNRKELFESWTRKI